MTTPVPCQSNKSTVSNKHVVAQLSFYIILENTNGLPFVIQQNNFLAV